VETTSFLSFPLIVWLPLISLQCCTSQYYSTQKGRVKG
jgi:hypothetical protein